MLLINSYHYNSSCKMLGFFRFYKGDISTDRYFYTVKLSKGCDVTFCIVCSIGDLNELTMCLEFISLVIQDISIAWAESSTEWHFWLPVTWRPSVCRVSFNSTHSHLLPNNHWANFNQSCQNSSLGLFVYLFVCLGFYIQIENFSFI